MKKVFLLGLLGIILISVMGCGQTGRLYLPEADSVQSGASSMEHSQ